MLSLVAWGIYHSVRNSTHQLQTQRTELRQQANQLREQAEVQQSTLSPAQQQALLQQAEVLETNADNFWKASPGGLVLAGVLYALGMLPASLYWRQCLLALGQTPDLLTTIWAYFYGNLGKYFPGKAMVLVLRVSALEKSGVQKIATSITIFMETLTMMAVGGAIAAICLILLDVELWLTLLAVGLLLVTFVPTYPPVLRRLIPKLQKNVAPQLVAQWVARAGWRLTIRGWLALTLTWLLFGASLLSVLLSLPSTEIASSSWFQLFLSSLGACALAVVVGFVSLIPGGAGVREVVLSTVLAPVVGPTAALCGALWMRIVWLTTELSTVGGLAAIRLLPSSTPLLPSSTPPGSPSD
ncbi:hypothetical protein Q31a_55730 [Aureliella helgolandensis]|uniref:Uncharacterized protein n=1 Tax=Aureliella helgolandensis TaxID=2527968 RepID=A0A518GF04_9BACT|nr:hypothetical protein Q31a_55730 [Aureliella helgolandensis]